MKLLGLFCFSVNINLQTPEVYISFTVNVSIIIFVTVNLLFNNLVFYYFLKVVENISWRRKIM